MTYITRINPFRCRMWTMHDRLGEEISKESCMALIQSIAKHGQKRPALGRPVKGEPDVDVELIFGARRLFAAKHLGIDLLVEVRDIDDREALVEMDIENRVREDISHYERGLSYRHWLRAGFFRNQADLAKHLGVSEAQVSRLLRYADLPAAVVDAFKSPRDIREGWAVALAKRCLTQDHRRALIKRARTCKASSVRRTPEQIFEFLTRSDAKSVGGKNREEVVKDLTGKPLLRVAFRARAVHLILPRENMSQALLDRITERVAAELAQDHGTAATELKLANDRLGHPDRVSWHLP